MQPVAIDNMQLVERWEVQSQLYQRDICIKSTIMMAFFAVAIFMAASLPILMCHSVVSPIGSALIVLALIVSFISYPIIGNYYFNFSIFDFTQYGDKRKACSLVFSIKKSEIREMSYLNAHLLNKYGFISDQSKDSMLKLQREYFDASRRLFKASWWSLNRDLSQLKAENECIKKLNNSWVQFRDNELAKDLPNFRPSLEKVAVSNNRQQGSFRKEKTA